ncbi:MAG: MATE family efflux transporter [Saprospiraceae bacterium]|nr:MATE family efflux transporter [Saprospiraceae bacterium]
MPKPELLKYIWRLSIPVLLTNLLQTSVTVIDTYMVGRLGPLAIAAVGMGNTLRLMLLIAVLSVSGGAMSLIAQAKGARDETRMSLVTRQGIVSGLLLSIFLAGLGFAVAPWLLSAMENGGQEGVIELSYQYLTIIFIGTPFLTLNIIMDRLMQGAGDTFTPLLLTIGTVILNVVFNYCFIFGWWIIPAYGLVGAAIGTVLARVIVVIIGFTIFYSGRNVIKILSGTWWPDWPLIKDILAIGVPSGIQGWLRHAGGLVAIGIVTATELGTYGAAVLTIGWQVESLAAQPVVGLNVAGTSLVGQALGRWQTQQAYYQGNIMIVLGIVVMGILVTPMILFAEEIILLFDPTAHPKVLEGGLSYFRVNTIFLPITAIAILITGTLRGAGDTRPAMISTLIGRNLLTIISAWILAIPMGYGAIGVWYGMAFGRVVDGIYMWWVWRARKWVQVALEKTAVFRTHLQRLPPEEVQRYLKEVRAVYMAVPNTLELVSDQRVEYRSPGQTVRVHFKDQKFTVSQL